MKINSISNNQNFKGAWHLRTTDSKIGKERLNKYIREKFGSIDDKLILTVPNENLTGITEDVLVLTGKDASKYLEKSALEGYSDIEGLQDAIKNEIINSPNTYYETF